MAQALLYAAALVLAAWGAAHLANTRAAVDSLHPHDRDARRIITMEWIGEGSTLLFVAALLAAVATASPSRLGDTVLLLDIVVLNVMSAVSLATGSRVDSSPIGSAP